MPVELAVDWQAIRLAAVAGVEYRTLAIEHGMFKADGKPDTNAIRQRSSREKWPVPSAIHARAVAAQREAAKQAHAARQAVSQQGQKMSQPVTGEPVTVSQPGFSAAQSGETASVTVTDNLLDLAKSGSLRFAKVAHRSLAEMPDSLPICSPSDALTTIKGLRLMAGMDSGEGSKVAVQVQLWQSPAYRQATQSDPFEVEVIAETPSTDISDY